MLPLLIFIALGILIAVLYEVRAHRQAKTPAETRTTTPTPSDGCCGQHLVCERETLLQTNDKIIYYDDEELDQLSGMEPAGYTPEQRQMLREVFDTLNEEDVTGWVRSLQLRNIQLPDDIRDEALLIVRERRNR